jgi:hypothetical protein
MVFCLWSAPGHERHVIDSQGLIPCGGGVEYLHRSPASRRRRQKGNLESETVKYDRESHRTRTRE